MLTTALTSLVLVCRGGGLSGRYAPVECQRFSSKDREIEGERAQAVSSSVCNWVSGEVGRVRSRDASSRSGQATVDKQSTKANWIKTQVC
jgi:hypothetical protein